MKLLSGYSIKKVKKNQWALIMGADCPCCGEFTGLYVECKNKKSAIEIFNDHIPILEGKLLNSPILIKKNQAEPKRIHIFVETIKNRTKMENVSYMYNELDVIGAIGKSIYVRTKIPIYEMETPDFGFQVDEEWVCLVFTMTSWMELQKEWIKNKKKICEMYGHFCGWSDIQSDVEYVGEINMRIEEQLPDGKWNDRYEMVRALKPKNFQVCMEHGQKIIRIFVETIKNRTNMSKKLDAAIELAQLHYEVVTIFGHDMETDVFPFIQENWTKGHKLFQILEEEKYGDYIPYVMKNFTLKQINQFFEELSICFLVDQKKVLSLQKQLKTEPL